MLSRVILLICVAVLCIVSAEAVAQSKRPIGSVTADLMDPALLQMSTETEDASTSAASAELISSLKMMLEQRKASDEAARAKLEAAAERTLAVEHALAEKSAQLKTHNKIMSRLESCLAEGPSAEKYAKQFAAMQAKETVLLEQKNHLETQLESLKEQESAMASASKKHKELEAELADKNEQLRKKQAELDAQHSLIAQREKSLTDRENTLLKQLNEAAHVKANQEAEINRRVAEKVNEIHQSFLQEKEKAVAAVRAEMHTEMTSLIEKQQHMVENERLASKIAAKHEMKRLTSAEGEIDMAGAELLDTMLVETGARNGSRSHENSGERCASYNDCSSCGADGACAWCGATKLCLPLDVNSNFRGKSSSIDGLTSGQCPADQWQTEVSSRLTLLSLNVFASDHSNSTKRFAAVVQLLKKTAPDVVGFQEVEKWFVHALQAHAWVKANYHFADFGPGQAPGGLYILSRYPISSTSYYEEIQPGQVSVSERGRVLVATLGVRQHALSVAVTNLDWRTSENRAKNLDYVFHILKQYPHVFLLGDFNFDDGSKPETDHIPQSYIDIWSTLNPENPGFTWDPRHNWFAASSDPNSRSSRLDRVYVRSNQWMPRSVHLVGCSVADPLCASRNIRKNNQVSIVSTTSDLANPSVLIGQKKTEEKVAPGTPKPVVHRTPAFLETAVDIGVAEDDMALVEAAAATTFDGTFVPSNHYGLLIQATHFHPKC